MASANNAGVVAALVAALAVGPAAAQAPPGPAEADAALDSRLFDGLISAERGERLRLAAGLDPDGWPALRRLARSGASATSVAAVTALAELDEAVARLEKRVRPELRHAPLDALEAWMRANLVMLGAVQPANPKLCAMYLWTTAGHLGALRRAAKDAGRGVELATLRAAAAARAVRVDHPPYYTETGAAQQPHLRAQRLDDRTVALVLAAERPPGFDDATVCRATIAYGEAVLTYPLELRSTVLAALASEDFGYGEDDE